MKIKLVILDFDGTLGDTRRNILESLQEVMRTAGWRVASVEECDATIGVPLKEGFRMLYPELTDEELDGCCATYRKFFFANCEKLVPDVFPHVRETLEEMQRRGMVMTIASSRNRPSLMMFLERMGLKQYFSYILGGEDAAKAKPDPEPVLKTMRDLGYAPEETLVVGDTNYDILMGCRAGAHTCGVTYGVGSRAQLEEAGAEWLIDDFGKILEIFR